MPLTELVRYLNGRPQQSPLAPHAPRPFAIDGQQVVARFADLLLASRFLPIVDCATGRLHGHRALLEVRHLQRGTPLTPQALFVLPSDDEEFISLDRLVRTLHALNYLTHRLRGNLLLQVHPRHVRSVPAEHGLAFEEILRPCGLLPTQITLELDIAAPGDQDHLPRAAHNYRRRGYQIAVGRFGRQPADYVLLARLQPSIVALDESLFGQPRDLRDTATRIRNLGALTLAQATDPADDGLIDLVTPDAVVAAATLS